MTQRNILVDRGILKLVINVLRRDERAGKHVRGELANEVEKCCQEDRTEELEKEIQRLQELIKEAPHYFHPGYDFDGNKVEWLKKANLIED